MIRQSLNANSKHAFMAITPERGAAFQRRTSTGATSYHTPGTSVTAPYWVKLERTGSTFKGYQSADGQTWALVDTISVSNDSLGNPFSEEIGSFSWSQDAMDVYLNFTPAAVPEPSTFALAALSLIGLAWFGWRRRK